MSDASSVHPFKFESLTGSSINVVGIDISKAMIDFARMRASSYGRDNATFLLMDATKPFKLESSSFDLVNARLLNAFLKREQWPVLLAEMMRVLRPGGYLRLTETCKIETSSQAGKEMVALVVQALQSDGRLYGHDSEGNITEVCDNLVDWLTQAGCQVMGNQLYSLDWSWNAPAHESMYQDVLLLTSLLKPLVTQKMKLVSEREYDRLFQENQVAMYQPNFRGSWYYRSVWGRKPA